MKIHHSMIVLSALSAALAAPVAFAQSSNANAAAQDSASMQTTPPVSPTLPTTASPTEDAGLGATPADPANGSVDNTTSTSIGATGATAATPATPATPASGSAHAVNWSQLDTDSNGSLSKTEAAAVTRLGSVFDKADANADGALTPDEYKAYASVHGKSATHHHKMK